uniref:Uncharacterized protein n=1 Tax=Neogobius melanostomus TaxID=47308 RepID=A0A8C6U5S6_9GOBI
MSPLPAVEACISSLLTHTCSTPPTGGSSTSQTPHTRTAAAVQTPCTACTRTISEGPPVGPLCPERGPSGGPEVDAIYRAVVDAASKGMHVTITATVSGTTQASPVPALSAMSAFTASIGDPVNLPQAVSAVLHGQEGDSRSRVLRRAPKHELAKSALEGPDGGEYFRSPGRGTPRNQWDREQHLPGLDSQNHWGGEEFLECSTQVRSSPCVERPASLAPAPPCPSEGPNDHGMVLTHSKVYAEDSYRFNNCSRGLVSYKEQTPLNGTSTHFNSRPYGDVLTGDDQSPGSSTSLEGPLAKDYNHYNGHMNGMAPSPSDTKSLSSEEDLRPPDSPSSEPLYRSRTFNMGELVEPEKLKTLTHDLEALERAAKLGLK